MKWKVTYSKGEHRGFVEADDEETALELAFDLVERSSDLYGCWINYDNIKVECLRRISN